MRDRKASASTGKNAVRPNAATVLEVERKPNEESSKTLARVTLDPGVRHAQLAMAFAIQAFGDKHQPSIMDSTEVLAESLAKAVHGDKRLASRLLAAQAISLDAMFTELARRSANNLGQYLDASERYMRLALKAQSACRTTLEALAKIHQPREQTVKHVHVNDGGQAVVADHVHHTGGAGNEKPNEQSDATRTVGERAALPCPDPSWNGMPSPGSQGSAALQDARRDEPGGT